MKGKTLLLKPNYAKVCTITQDSADNYMFSNIRDFTWTSEDRHQKQHWIDDTYNPRDIEKVYYFTAPFGPWNMIAHTMLSFHFVDGRDLCLSIEAPLHEGEEYSFWKALWGQYRIMYIWGTQHDHVSLRTDLRGNLVDKYLLDISKQHAEDLFISLIQETQKLVVQKEKYGLIRNNCITALWRIASSQFKLPRWSFALLFSRLTPRFLAKLDLIHLKGKKILKGK